MADRVDQEAKSTEIAYEGISFAPPHSDAAMTVTWFKRSSTPGSRASSLLRQALAQVEASLLAINPTPSRQLIAPMLRVGTSSISPLDGRGGGGEGERLPPKHRPTPLAPLDAADRSDPRFPLRAHNHSPPRATAHEPGDSHRPPQP